MQRCWRTTTPPRSSRKTSIWPGQAGNGRLKSCAPRLSGGCGGPRSWPSAATRSTRAWPCWHRAVSLESEPREQAAIWQRIGHAYALKYDGEGFWQAMQHALDIGGPSAEVYADLALKSVQRAGMWVKQPDMTLVDGWIDQALELGEEGSRTQGKAFAARAMMYDDESAARSALAIAERLGDLDLRCTSLGSLSGAALTRRDFDGACALIDQVMEHLPELNNPTLVHGNAVRILRVPECRATWRAAAWSSAMATEAATGLTEHHRLHAAAWQILLPSCDRALGRSAGPWRRRPSGWWTPTWPRPHPAS